MTIDSIKNWPFYVSAVYIGSIGATMQRTARIVAFLQDSDFKLLYSVYFSLRALIIILIFFEDNSSL